MNKQAFIIRCAPGGISRVEELLTANQIVIGWSETRNDLFNINLNWDEFKGIIRKAYHPHYEDNVYSLGQAAGYLWRFIREMQVGDYAVVPIPRAFYVAEIIEEVEFIEDKIEDDTAIRRKVKWLHNQEPVSRNYCRAGLVSRLKYQGTCVDATDLIDDLETAMANSVKGKLPNFKHQLNESLKTEVVNLLGSKEAYLDDVKFEKLVSKLMIALGATTAEIPSKTRYPNSIADVDVLANFIHLGLQIYVQVKKHSHKSDKYAIEQIVEALKIDNPDYSKPIYGWAVTSGQFDEEAETLANKNGIRIINGDELAEMIVGVGLNQLEE